MFIATLPKQETWTTFIDDGKQFHHTAVGGLAKRKVFTAQILYNIFCMAMEKYFMGYTLFYKDLPYNHTFRDFAEAVARIGYIDPGLLDDLLFIDSFQEICAIDFYERKDPTETDIAKIAQICNRVKAFVLNALPEY